MITTVIFDMDDTLYDELDYCKSGFNAVAKFMTSLPSCPPEKQIFNSLWKQFTSGNRKTTFNAALDELTVKYDDAFIDRLIEVYRNHTPDIKLPAESKLILQQLASDYKLGLLTDGFLPAQQLKVKALGIEKYFKVIVYTEQLGRQFWKPSAVGFKKLLQELNSKPENTAYIGDNEKKDFIAPNRLGIVSIQLIRPARIHTEPSQVPGSAARYIIGHITELAALLQKF